MIKNRRSIIGYAGSKRRLKSAWAERFIAVAIFVVCIVLCAWIIAESQTAKNNAADLRNAVVAAKDGAEAFKALGLKDEIVYYNADWMVCSQADAAFVMRFISVDSPLGPPVCILVVEKITGEEIIAFTVAMGGGLRE
jgi:hypothetical protein